MKYLFTIVLFALAAPVWAQEKITLTTPVTEPAITDLEVGRLCFDRMAASAEFVLFHPPSGKTWPAITYTGADALAMFRALNKANLSTANNSLNFRIINRLRTDGKIPTGTVGGTPE